MARWLTYFLKIEYMDYSRKLRKKHLVMSFILPKIVRYNLITFQHTECL